jgi:hypothetical protein
MSIGAFLGNLGTVLDTAQSQMKRQQEVKMKQIEFQHAQQAAQLGAIADKIDMAAQLHQAGGGDQQPPGPYSVSQGFGGGQSGGGAPMAGGGAPGGPGPLPGAQRMAPPPGPPQQPQQMMPGQQVRPQNPQMQGGMSPGGGGGVSPQQPGLGDFQPTTFNDVVQQMRAVAPPGTPPQAILMAARNAWPQIQQANKDKLEVFKAQQAADDRKDTRLDREQFHADTEADRQATRALSAQEHADSLAMRREALALQAGKGQIFQKPDGSLVRVTEDGRSVPIKDSVGLTKPGAGGGGGALDKDTLKEMAGQYLAGDKSVMQNIGRGTQGAANIVALRKEITAQAKAAGLSPTDIATKMAEFSGLTAGERTLGTRSANMGMAVDEAKRVIPLALAASEAFPRTQFVPLNKAIAAVQSGSGDPAVSRFVAANTSLVNVYARAMSPTGTPTVSDKDHAREMLSVAQTKEQYRAVIDQMQQEMDAAGKAPGDVKVELSGGTGGGQGQMQPVAGAEVPTAVNPQTGQKLFLRNGQWTPQ